MRPIAGGTCSICGERIISSYAFVAEGEARCGLCQQAEPPFAKAAAYGSYEGGLRELIHLLKYEQVRPAANVLGRMLAEVIDDLASRFSGPVLVVPVPLSPRKLRQRSFNQSELITRAALKLRNAECFVLAPAVLERCRETQSQTGLSRHQRQENVRGAFAVAKPCDVTGGEILLVDDVFTTGTTVSECARILKRAGASKIWVATVARTLKADAQFAPPEVEEEFEDAKAVAAGA